MARLDELPADQRAVLQLLLARGQSYGRIAETLGLGEDTVRARAHAAVDALGPESAGRLPDERRAAVADYLLGQQDDAASAATREHLEASAGARAWARVVSGELRPLAANREFPEIPRDGARAVRTERASRRGAPAGAAAGRRNEGEAGVGDAAREGDAARGEDGAAPVDGRPRDGGRRSSRLGGALLIGGLAILVVVLVVVLVNGGSDGDSPTTSTSAARSQAQRTTTQPTKVLAQVNMKGEGSSLGLAQVLVQGKQRAIAIQGQDLAPTTTSSAYAVWLYNSGDDAARLGYTPAVGKNGRLQGVAALPANAAKYKELIVTREASTKQAAKPGKIVLRGSLGLSS
jgi:anti-sigma-K factor RskA/sigma-70-like protein